MAEQKAPVSIWPALLVIILLMSTLFCDQFWPYRITIPSPTGQYALEERYIDMGGWGYRGKTYLLAKRRYYKVDDVGPGYAYWLDEEKFSVYGETYAVSDFIDRP